MVKGRNSKLECKKTELAYKLARTQNFTGLLTTIRTPTVLSQSLPNLKYLQLYLQYFTLTSCFIICCSPFLP